MGARNYGLHSYDAEDTRRVDTWSVAFIENASDPPSLPIPKGPAQGVADQG